jgi:hypothetical protein
LIARAGGAPSGGDAEQAMREAVAKAVRNLAARRLARGFLPLGLVFLFGAMQMAFRGALDGDYAVLTVGAMVAAGAMLVYGNGAVRRALGAQGAVAGWVTTTAGLVPYVFALYLLGFRGLRPLASSGPSVSGVVGRLVALGFLLVAAKLLWDLSHLTRLHILARTMTMPTPEERR